MSNQNRPLRVAMLTQRYIPFTGGAEKQLSAVLRRLPAFGIEAIVVTRLHDESPTTEFVEGIRVHRIKLRGPRPYASLTYTAKAIGILRRFRPDIVHAHELLSPSTTAIAYKALFGVPVVAKVLRGGSLGDIAVLEGSRSGRLRLPRILKGIDAFAVISSEIDAELAARGVAADRRRFIPNGVDLDRFALASDDEKQAIRNRLDLPDTKIALFVGRLTREKRIDQLVALWPRVRSAVPGAVLVVAGTGDLAGALKAQAGPGVTLVGGRDDLRDFYAAADIFVLPSEAEGLSNALLEAMAMGLPSVVTAVGAAPELLRDDDLGQLVSVDDDEALLAGIIATFHAVSANRSERSRDRIVQSYGIEATAKRLAGLYHSFA